MPVILLFVFLFVSIDSFSQALPKEIQLEISNKCDSNYVFTTIIRSNTLKEYFPSSAFSKFYDKESHYLRLDTESRKKEFIKEVNKFYEMAVGKKKIAFILQHWCRENQYLNNLAGGPEFPPEAILFNAKSTRYLFDKYLDKSLPAQGWYSLSSYQLYELNIDYLNFTEKMSKEELTDLHTGLEDVKKKHWEKVQ